MAGRKAEMERVCSSLPSSCAPVPEVTEEIVLGVSGIEEEGENDAETRGWEER